LPTYEYACTACGHKLDAVQKFTDEPLTVCPECGGALRKVFGAVGIAFKGSGFYKTDSRNGSGGSKSSASSKDSGGDSASSTSSDSSSKSDSSSGTSSSSGDSKSTPSSGDKKSSTPAATPAS
jgi:putative FmdB family regulatory protein